MGLPSLAMEREKKDASAGFRASSEDLARWGQAALVAGRSYSDWARAALNAAAAGRLGVDTPRDPEFQAALDRMLRRYPIGDSAGIIRMCVLAIDAMEEAGTEPFRVLRRAPAPKVSPGARKGSPDRG